jgi:membrane protease YdiL (CAAX protease family)
VIFERRFELKMGMFEGRIMNVLFQFRFIRDSIFNFCLLLLILVSLPATGEESGASDSALPEAGMSAPALVAASFPLAALALGFVPVFAPETSGTMNWIAYPLKIGSHVPLYWIDAGRAFGYTLAGLLLPGASIGLMFAGDSFALALPLSATLMNAYSHLMEYAAYDTYRLSRIDLGGRDLGELAAAPFIPDTFLSPLVWIPSIVAPAVLVGYNLLAEPGMGTPVYESGRSYIGSAEVHPVLGGISAGLFGTIDMLSVAIGEESYYRGILYENVKRELGTIPARVFDMLFFPAIHIQSDIRSGTKTETMIFNFAWRSAMTLIFDVCYDTGGLERSTATHFWSDFILIMARWVFCGG